MCDDRTLAEDREWLSRRRFAALGLAGLAACATRGAPPEAAPAAAADDRPVTRADVSIPTADGACDALLVHPVEGRHPAILYWPDIKGLRPTFETMATRLAREGYAVLVPNPFYRSARAPVLAPGESFSDPPVRERLFGYLEPITPDQDRADARALLAWLDAHPAVAVDHLAGTAGYCMGGSLAFRAAEAVPERVGAVASFHGGGLVDAEDPDSPHLALASTRARYLVAVAENDHERDPSATDTLKAAFGSAGRTAEVEVYPARHGWCTLDSDVYDAEQAERAWARFLALLAPLR